MRKGASERGCMGQQGHNCSPVRSHQGQGTDADAAADAVVAQQQAHIRWMEPGGDRRSAKRPEMGMRG